MKNSNKIIRSIFIEGERWYVAKDMCEPFEVNSKQLTNHCRSHLSSWDTLIIKKSDGIGKDLFTSTGGRLTLVTPGGLWMLANKFRYDWIKNNVSIKAASRDWQDRREYNRKSTFKFPMTLTIPPSVTSTALPYLTEVTTQPLILIANSGLTI
jgi:hypothetical protein